MVNSIVPRDATYALRVDFSNADTSKWEHVISGYKAGSKGSEGIGITKNEMLSKHNWDENLVARSIESGDVQIKDGKYWWQRAFEREERGKSERLTYSEQKTGGFDKNQILKLIDDQYDKVAQAVQWARQTPSACRPIIRL